jgi:signal transduction histidine kinase
MLNSLHACGKTLLDTINHVMDYAKISEAQKSVSSKRIKNSNTVRLSSKPLKGRRKKDPSFDFGIATEEVVEAVFSGLSYVPITSKLMEAPQSPSEEGMDSYPQRKICFVVLDLAPEDDWVFSFPIGSWRRIVMNLFGNALKYTQTGCKYTHITFQAAFHIYA